MITDVAGYLPNDKPGIGRLILLGLQHVLTMFPATVFVALVCGFHVSTVLFGAGVSTIVALILSRRAIGTFIPLFYGSSVSYIGAYLGIVQSMGHKVQFGMPAPDEVISVMQTGIIATGVLTIIIGFVRKAIGKSAGDRVLPPVVTGSVACVFGIGLAKAALDMSFMGGYWGIALLTLVATVAFSYLLQGKGFIGMLPILLGAIVGYLFTLAVAPDQISFRNVAETPVFVAPHFTGPALTGPMVTTAIFSIAIMAIATIPESTAHLYQISLYVERLQEEQGRKKPRLDRYVGFNLIFDGVGDALHGIVGATAGTNYGENNSLMALTRNYSGPALLGAGVIFILLRVRGTPR